MPILALLAPLVSWLIRAVVVKFIILTAVFALIEFLIPKLIALISPYIGVGSLTSSFGGISPGVWFFLDAFDLSYGVPLLLSAYLTRFFVRRLPVIG